MANILITGGAGYIGSHVVKQFSKTNHHIVVIDNLSTGFEDAVVFGKFIKGDTGDSELVSKILRENKIDTIIHFAAHTIVPESVENPLKYYKNNTANTRNLLECAHNEGVERFIFSSTAAVYGIPKGNTCKEEDVLNPVNPYGTSKLMSEIMLKDLAQASGMRYVILRYFNVAGCDPEGKIGQSTEKATLLTKVAVETAVGKRKQVAIYGTDYETEDGTGVRDYIHVEDLASAHIKALEYLLKGGENVTLNCGYGHGYSVRQVLDEVARANSGKLNVVEEKRRAGDPPTLIADASKIKQVLGWHPKYDDLREIVSSSLNWERKLQEKAKSK